MKNSNNPLVAGYAAHWLRTGLVPVPVDADGTQQIDVADWASKPFEDIADYYADHPLQNYQLMGTEGRLIFSIPNWPDYRTRAKGLDERGLACTGQFDVEEENLSTTMMVFDHAPSLDITELESWLGRSIQVFVPPTLPPVTISVDDSAGPLEETEAPDEATDEMATVETPLEKHSLLGHEDEVESQVTRATPLLGSVILMGQFSLIYAQPNTGKTLLTISLLQGAVEEGRLNPANAYYVNADDNSEGMGEKLRLFNEMGAHTLVPGYQGFDAGKLISLLNVMIADQQCGGVVVILDTLKTFTDLMDKKKSSQFAKVIRQFVAAGGTFIGLAHTNKNPGSSGKPIYAGTSDFYEAADVCCYLIPVETTPQGDKIVKFELFKKRGGGNRDEAYSYLGSNDVSYDQLVASVQMIDPDDMEKYENSIQRVEDQTVIDAICEAIIGGTNQKMALAKHVATTTKASRRQVVEVLERYTGSDVTEHMWDFVVGERGAKQYTLHAIQHT